MACGWLLLLTLLLSAPAAQAESSAGPFALSERRVPGRAIDATVVRDETGRERVLILSIQGDAPRERRFASWLPLDPARAVAPIEIPTRAVAVDAAELGLAPGPELVWVAAGEVRIVAEDGRTLRSDPIQPPLPLPPRTWELARYPLIRDWDGDGRDELLLPGAAGLILHPLAPGDERALLSAPLVSDYGTPTLENWFRPGLLTALIAWPTLALGDDDGDGRADLYAADRFELLVFRNGAAGLPAKPSARRPFAPFSPEEERRHVATTLLTFVRDLDGDGLADLVVHRMVGNLMRSNATTTVYRNTGTGPDPQGSPWVELEARGGTSAIELADLDGDGRVELLEAHIPIGIVQAVRMLTLGRLETRLRVLALPAQPGAPPVETWASDVSFPFDFDSSRVLGVMPHTKTDWNGDGLLDLCWGDGSGELRFRLGERRSAGPGYGPVVGAVELPVSGNLVAADLDGDGLQDFLITDPLDRSGTLPVGINRGTLPGTRPALHAP